MLVAMLIVLTAAIIYRRRGYSARHLVFGVGGWAIFLLAFGIDVSWHPNPAASTSVLVCLGALGASLVTTAEVEHKYQSGSRGDPSPH